MRVERASIRDWTRLAEMESVCFPFLTATEIRYDIISYFDASWVWRNQGVVMAFALCYLLDERTVWVERLGVDVALRGQGIGKRFLSELERVFAEAGMTRVQLAVFERNAAAIRLYEAMGYDEISRDGVKRGYSKNLPATSVSPPGPLLRRCALMPLIFRKAAYNLLYRVIVPTTGNKTARLDK